jgi:hypothetical protein
LSTSSFSANFDDFRSSGAAPSVSSGSPAAEQMRAATDAKVMIKLGFIILLLSFVELINNMGGVGCCFFCYSVAREGEDFEAFASKILRWYQIPTHVP